ncbi:alpha-(1-2)-phosphatidylinositol mannosyltransferase [Prauserella marina]|uniref:phosphatidyl-myo-inositol dimannoside synthase n=1 Tax=Prauserella marina TaxID=530584 RepID=A0A222VLX9_9PSEU|nr:glycosyltransferase family 4 protein [Prauserella marina]ASR34926.1 alpha-(1-2)-phosphatidylinositol mannosyltransferase [Prauserella marina]PWV85364.1 phosphatidylinositol alpha-1,6-mannosyltransferase [Prauserella marina]SDC56566.1 phosphatidylinositol alpha-1,6-mannosyltransferase [Prauserella marina]
MRRTLLVTNDFPPRPGGIQSYLLALASRLPAEDLVVYAPAWERESGSHREFDATVPFEVVRHPTSLMLPTPDVLRRAKELVRSRGCDAVWFGAAAPLALLGEPLRAAGASRVVACTHGHEVGWSMLPAARQALRRIGNTADVVTFVSEYTRNRFAAAFGPMAGLEHLPSGVDTEVFRPDEVARAELRHRYGLTDRPTVVCVSRLVPRKGQDMLVRALPRLRERIPGAALLLVGGGPYRKRLAELADENGVTDHVIMTGSVPWEELPSHYCAGDVFAMPARTRGKGLDVEGLGIVYLEASASGLPVVAGNSGGAPETVLDEVTGHVVDGRELDQLTETLAALLADPVRARRMGEAGREWVQRHWRWDILAGRLAAMLDGTPVSGLSASR